MKIALFALALALALSGCNTMGAGTPTQSCFWSPMQSGC